MSAAQTKFVTIMALTCSGGVFVRSSCCGDEETLETWVFIWQDIDALCEHLHGLVQNPKSGFVFADLLWVMDVARWQLRNTERRKLLALDAVSTPA